MTLKSSVVIFGEVGHKLFDLKFPIVVLERQVRASSYLLCQSKVLYISLVKVIAGRLIDCYYILLFYSTTQQ